MFWYARSASSVLVIMGRQGICGIATKADVSPQHRAGLPSRQLTVAGSRCNGGQGAGVGLSTCLCIHAEENALLEAGRERIREGAILYCDTYVSATCSRSRSLDTNASPRCPCLTCSIKITQVGISEVVFNQTYSMDKEASFPRMCCLSNFQPANSLQTAAVFKEAGIHLRQFSPVRFWVVLS